MRVPVHGAVINQAEDAALIEVIKRRWYTEGPACAEFTRKLKAFTGARDVTLVNSGSSANLLAMTALAQPELGEHAIKPGDEVITTALCFPTTLAPILQIGAVPVFVDVDLPILLPSIDAIVNAISEKTKAVFVTHTLGNPLPMAALDFVCASRDLWLIEDCCDALGSPDLFQYSDLATISFFPAHQVTTGEGGAVVTNNPRLGKLVRSLRDWGKDCWCAPGKDDTCGKRFEGGRDHKYTFARPGYNLKMTDFQGALGSAQMDKLPDFVETRNSNHERLNYLMRSAGMDKFFTLPPDNFASWFGYALICNGDDRDALTQHLERRGVQTRRVFAGNILNQPGYSSIEYRIAGELTNTDIVDARGFWVGCWPGLCDDQLRLIVNSIVEYIGGAYVL